MRKVGPKGEFGGVGDTAREAMRQPQEKGCPGDQDAELRPG